MKLHRIPLFSQLAILWFILIFLSSCQFSRKTSYELKSDNNVVMAKKRLFFHWQNPEGNAELLRLGGLPFEGLHHLNLHEGSSAVINSAVMERIQNWYSVKKSDLAGSGFYMSSDLMTSVRYGSDLLIVEVEALPSIDIESFEKRPNIKEISDKAHANGLVDSLPVISRYSNETYHVISRPPTPNDGIKVSFRPPTDKDIQTMARNLLTKSKGEAGELMASISQLEIQIRRNLIKLKELTPSSRIVLHRLYYDYSLEALQQIKMRELRIDQVSLLEVVLLGFVDLMPENRLVKELVQSYARHFPFSKRVASGSNLMPYLNIFEFLTSAQKNDIVQAALKLDQATIQKNHLFLLGLVEQIKKHSIEKAEVLSLRLKNIPWESDGFRLDSLESLNRVLQVIPRGASSKAAAIGLVQNSWSWRAFGNHIMIEDLLKTVIRKDGSLSELIGYYRDLIPKQKSQRHHYTALLVVAAFNVSSSEQLRSGLASQLVQLTKGIESEFDVNSNPFELPDVYKFLKNLGPKSTLGLIEKTIDAEPRSQSFLTSILQGLNNSPEKFEITQADDVFQLRELLKKVQNRRKDYQTVEEMAELAWAKIASHKKYVDRKKFVTSFIAVNENIRGSNWHSEVSRMFLLVDPIFVSEDLRRNSAQWPFNRFNELYQTPKGQFQLPSWQNFLLAWLEASSIHLENGFDFNRMKSDMLFSWEVNKYVDVNRTLISSFVDGAEATQFNPNWDRSQYKTIFTKSEFDRMIKDGDRAEVNKFFDVKFGSKNTVELTFRSANELMAEFGIRGQESQGSIFEIAMLKSFQHSDPIKRAAAILHYLPKLHPFEKGNGRMARMIAGIELVRSGYSLPVGLPTNDFLMTEERLEWEVRKALIVGRFYHQMLEEAQKKGFPKERFFQERYRGSRVEALSLLQASSLESLKSFVRTMESWKSIPEWIDGYLPIVEVKLKNFIDSGLQWNESEREQALREASETFFKNNQSKFHAFNLGCDQVSQTVKGIFNVRPVL